VNEVTGPRFDWAGQTAIHPLGMLAVIVLGVMMLLLPRRWALLPIVLTACLIAPGQRIVVLSLNFDLLRIMVLLGWIRLVLRNEASDLVWKKIDWLVVAWALSGTIIYTLQNGTLEAMKYRLGTSFDALGMYFLFRCLVKGWEDVDQAVRCFILVSIPVAVAFAFERATGHNLFSIFGYVPSATLNRDGILRCQGAFAHPILAGCFWASLLPLIGVRWLMSARQRIESAIALAASGIIIYCCGSSTPVVAVLLGMAGMCMFPLRYHMKWVCWGTLFLLLELHLVMKAPVWHLLARLNILGGSTGWHRYYLINEAVNRLEEWWLLGAASTAHWGNGLFDLTNQYILEGVRGGLITLILFVAIIGLAFQGLGRLWRNCGSDTQKVMITWALGVSLFIHCMNFLAVSYFGQIIMVWYLLLAMIATLVASPDPRVSNSPSFSGFSCWRTKARGPLRRYRHHRQLQHP